MINKKQINISVTARHITEHYCN